MLTPGDRFGPYEIVGSPGTVKVLDFGALASGFDVARDGRRFLLTKETVNQPSRRS